MKTYLGIGWSEEEFLVETILLGINDQLRQLIEEYRETCDGMAGIGRIGILSLVYKLIGKCLFPPLISNYYDILVIDDKNNGFLLCRVGENNVRVIKVPNNFRLINRKKGKIISIKLNV